MSALLAAALVAAAAVPAAISIVTVASLRFARRMAIEFDADGEPREIPPPPPPPRPRDKDDDLPRIPSKNYTLRTCPMCGVGSRAADDAKLWVAGIGPRVALHGQEISARASFLGDQLAKKNGGPCSGFAVPAGLWQACMSCGAEWIVTDPPEMADRLRRLDARNASGPIADTAAAAPGSTPPPPPATTRP